MISRIAQSETTFGDIKVNNRLIMAPMSRNRATATGEATALMAKYYAQRASAGLIISEGIQPSEVGQGFANTPGLFTKSQVESWQHVTNAVHAKGGKIVAQIMHAGRIGHPSIYPSHHVSLAPSPVPAKGKAFTPDGMQTYPVPREMSLGDIAQTVADHTHSARLAIDAGFDGIEIHAGNGFLIHQFIAENTNLRTDRYGGNIPNRISFALEVINACVDEIGASRVGVRLSPANPYNDINEGDTQAIYQALIPSLPKHLAYVHVMEANNRKQTDAIREMWAGPLILNPHEDQSSWPASSNVLDPLLSSGLAEGISLGALFLANPDLVARLKKGFKLNLPDETTYYGGAEHGYTDYPTMENILAESSDE